MSDKKIDPIYSVLATLVLYNTSLDQSITFQTLSASLKAFSGKMDILVYDNSPFIQPKAAEHAQWNIYYFNDHQNPGVSKAYNEGFRLAQKLGKKWMLLLDQDTSFPLNAIEEYINTIAHAGTAMAAPILKTNHSIISPFRNFYGYGSPIKNILPGKHRLDRCIAVNSGLLVRAKVFDQAGGYNEAIKLDYSDLSFMYRLKQHFAEILVMNITCEHGFFNSSAQTQKQISERFKFYCQGAKMIFKETGDFLYLITAFVRTLKLTLKYRTLVYLKLFINM